jgi:hypothetical protein
VEPKAVQENLKKGNDNFAITNQTDLNADEF